MDKLMNYIPLRIYKYLNHIFIFIMPVLLYFFYKSTFVYILFMISIYRIYKIDWDIKLKMAALLINMIFVIPISLYPNTHFMGIATQICIYAILAVGLNIVVGFAGLLDLGYVAFYASGAYFYAIFASVQANNIIPENIISFPLSGMSFWLFLLLSMFVAGIVGIILGLPVLRLRGDYLAIVTLGFGEIIRIILNNLDKPINFTNGPKGISAIKSPELFGIVFDSPVHFYFIALFILILLMFFVNRVDKSKVGRAWVAIKEDELAARTMGIHLVRMKLMAFAYGAALAGMAGVIFAAMQQYIDPTSFTFMESIGILAMVILGGLGNMSGAVLGAAILVVVQLLLLKDLSQFLRDLSVSGIINIPSELDPAKYERFVFGIILILMCVFRPNGILPTSRGINYLKKYIEKGKSKFKLKSLLRNKE